MTVRALGFKDGTIENSVNYNQGKCTGAEGNCGCIHAEVNLLKNMPNPEIVIVSHSPCLMCAKALVTSGVKAVYFVIPYRKTEGVEFLIENNVVVGHLTTSRAINL